MNPVILLDEVDKLGADWRGDPSSALLEVLDPAQNHTFRDHYLESTSTCPRCCSSRPRTSLDTIPGPLLDRMEVLRLDGYTEEEKVAIARDHLLDRQRERNGLRADEIEVPDDVLRLVVTDYTREAGVRQLERELGKLLRKVAARLVERHGDRAGRRSTSRRCATRSAGPSSSTRRPSAATCPAWPPASPSPAPAATCCSSRRRRSNGDPGLTLTGQLGDVMKESAQIALLVRAGRTPTSSASTDADDPQAAPRARPRGRDPEGRSVGRRHDDDRAGQPAHRATGAARGRDDR